MDHSQEILRLIFHSNAGATLLENGDYSGALSYFRAALQTSKLLINEKSPQSKNQVQNERLLHLDSFMINGSVSRDSSNGNRFFYRHAIQVPEECSSIILNDTHSNAILSAIVIFNLALFHQRAAADNAQLNGAGCDPAGLLQKAIRLYESLFTLLQRGDIEDGSTLYMLHTLNNLGLAYEALNEKEKSEQCFRQVLSTVMCISTSDHDYLDGVNLSSLECFFGSTSHLIFPHCTLAASAA